MFFNSGDSEVNFCQNAQKEKGKKILGYNRDMCILYWDEYLLCASVWNSATEPVPVLNVDCVWTEWKGAQSNGIVP